MQYAREVDVVQLIVRDGCVNEVQLMKVV